MIILLLISGGLYIYVIASFFYGWLTLKPYNYAKNETLITVSIIIPVRNEQSNLQNLFNTLNNQYYPKEYIEIILIDDHSTDKSLEIAESLLPSKGKIIHLCDNKTGKKAALWKGLAAANGELLVTTDADCTPGPDWIKTLVNYYIQHKPALILSPVIGEKPSNFFESWQQLEILSLLGSTAGSVAIRHPIMCNGANLAFPREYLNELRNIYLSENIASGDDMFVLEHLKRKYPGKIHFIKSVEATIATKLATNLSQFIHQRKRWASKARFYNDTDIIFSAIAVLQINIFLLSFLIFAFITKNYTYFLLLLALKSAIDLPFLLSIASFFKNIKTAYWFPLLQCVYFFYVSFTFLGSFTSNFNWKSRKLRA